MSWSSRKKIQGIFAPFILSEENTFQDLCFISMYSVLNTLSEYTSFCISKNITSDTFLLVFKIVESLHCILKSLTKNVYFAKTSDIQKKSAERKLLGNKLTW